MSTVVWCRCNCAKTCYTSKHEAQHVRNVLHKRGIARDLEVYQCRGACWHLSHRPFKGFDDNGRRFRK